MLEIEPRRPPHHGARRESGRECRPGDGRPAWDRDPAAPGAGPVLASPRPGPDPGESCPVRGGGVRSGASDQRPLERGRPGRPAPGTRRVASPRPRRRFRRLGGPGRGGPRGSVPRAHRCRPPQRGDRGLRAPRGGGPEQRLPPRFVAEAPFRPAGRPGPFSARPRSCSRGSTTLRPSRSSAGDPSRSTCTTSWSRRRGNTRRKVGGVEIPMSLPG